MKRILFAVALFLAPLTSALADGCVRIKSAAFIETTMAGIENGGVHGIAILGNDAQRMAKELEITVKVFAIFFIGQQSAPLTVFVSFETDDGTEGVCFTEADDDAKAALQKYLSRHSATNG